MTNMWDAATIDYERERLDGFITAATVAVAEQHGFVIQASTRQEFDDRLALVASAVEGAVSRVTYADPGSFPVVHQAVLASWERDFDIITEQRRVEAQRRNARRAYFRRSEKSAGFKVVDDSSGASTGTVYPNKEIAEQANYGDGYSVQYTDEKVKTAKVAANWQRQQDGPGESHWHLTPSDFRPGQWARISPVGDGFMLSIYAADGGDYTPDSLLLHERYETIEEAKEAAEHWRKTASLKTAKIEWGDVGPVEVNTYNGLTEKVLLWVAEEMGVTADIITLMGGYSWYVHSADNPDGSPLAEGQERTLERAKAMAERAMMEHSTQMSLFASRKKTAAYGYTDDEDYDRGYDSRDPDMNKPTSFEPFRVEIDCPACGARSTSIVSRMDQNIYCPSCGERQYGDSVQMIASKTAVDRSPNDIRSLVPGEAMGTWNVFRGYGDDDSASSQLGVKYEDLPEDARAWLQTRASKTAGENPFAKKDDEKKPAPKDDTTDSDADGEQDGPTQPGEQPEPKGDDQQAAPADPAAPQQDPAKPDVAQDKGQAQDPASAADTTQDQQQPADPTVMDVGQSTNMGFTMVDGGSTGSIEVTFVREENGVYFFNGPTGEFGVGQMNGQWQDADGNTFTFGGASAAPQGIGPAQEQAAAADAATPTPDPAANAQQPAPAAPADPNAAPAQDAPPADDAPKSDDSGEKKDDSGDGEKKENPFAKKSSGYPSSFGNQGYEHVRSLMELGEVPVAEWSDKELLAHLHDVKGASAEARKRNIWG